MMRNSEANKQKQVNCSVHNRCSSAVKYEKQIPRSSKPNDVNRKSQANGLPLLVESKSSLSSLTISSNSHLSIKPTRKSIKLSRDDHTLWKLYPDYILHPKVESKISYHKLSLGCDIVCDQSLKKTPRYQSLSIDNGIISNQYSPVVEKPKYLHLSLDERTSLEDDERVLAETPVQTLMFEKNEDPCIDTEPKHHNFSSDKETLQNSNLDRELFNCLEKYKRKIEEQFHILLDFELSEFVEDLKTTINNEISDYKQVENVPTLRELALKSIESMAVGQISSTYLTYGSLPYGLQRLVESKSSLSSLTISSNSLPSLKPKRKTTTLSRDDHTLWKVYPNCLLHPKVESKTSYHKLSLGCSILQDQPLIETPRYQSLSLDDIIISNQYSTVVEKPKYLHLSSDERTSLEDHRVQAGTPLQTHVFEKNDLNEDPCIDTEPKHHSLCSDKESLQNSYLKREFYKCIEEFIRNIHEQFHTLLDSKKGEKVSTLIEFPLRSQDGKAIDNIMSTHLTYLRKPPNLSTVTNSSNQASTQKFDSKPDAVKKKRNNNKPTKKGNNKKRTTAKEPWVN